MEKKSLQFNSDMEQINVRCDNESPVGQRLVCISNLFCSLPDGDDTLLHMDDELECRK